MWWNRTAPAGRASLLSALAVLALMLLAPAPAGAEVQYGTLSNFDVFNDTGEETHGFEIELDGISSSDVTYTFGAPYQARYGTPKLVDFPGGVYVIYESPYDAATKQFTQGTPLAPSPIVPTLGHQCWTGGSAEYFTSGCEHFGVSLLKSPTNTVYHWLVADQSKPGQLVVAGTKVNVPAPEFNVKPASPENPAPVVQAVVKAPEPEGNEEFGEALWVKVYVTESPQPAQLDHLVTDDPAVPEEESQTEVEWVLLQKERGGENPGAELAGEQALGEGDESVTRRYEIYRYTGKYDPESHEALPEKGDTEPGPSELGEYLGAQMAAVNVGPQAPADTTAPTAFIDSSPANPTGLTSASVSFHATDPDNNAFSFFCSLDGGATVPCTSPATYSGLADGLHTFGVEATDAAGNASKRVVAEWLVEQPLTASGQGIAGTATTEVAGVVAKFSDPEALATASDYSAKIEWGDGSSSSGSVVGAAGSFMVSGKHIYARGGSYTVKVLITDVDDAGNGATTSSTAKIIQATCTGESGTIILAPGLTTTAKTQTMVIMGTLTGCSGKPFKEVKFSASLRTVGRLGCSALTAGGGAVSGTAKYSWAPKVTASAGTLKTVLVEAPETEISGEVRTGSYHPLKLSGMIAESYAGTATCGSKKALTKGTFTGSAVSFE